MKLNIIFCNLSDEEEEGEEEAEGRKNEKRTKKRKLSLSASNCKLCKMNFIQKKNKEYIYKI